MNYLPSKLSKLRKHYSYSQQYVADKLGVDVIEYMNFENGNSMVNYGQMKKLASIYHISMNEMFKNTDNVELHKINNDTDELNARYFNDSNNIKNKIKGFIINHKVATIIIGILVLAIIVLSIILKNVTKPYEIKRENVNRLSVSDTTVIYIQDSGALGFTGSNSNGQLNDLAVTSAIKVCEGDSFSIVLNEDGTITSSGLIADDEQEVEGWKNIIDVAAGRNHVVAVDSNGRVYCVGDKDACEIENEKDVVKVFASNRASIVMNSSGTLAYSGNIVGTSYLKECNNILDLASSDNILAILNNDNTLSVQSKSGSYIKSETWNDIVDVTCGDDFVAGLDSKGNVYIDIDSDEIIEEVSGWTKIIAIAAGKDYLVGFDGKNIYGVGNNAYNQFVKEEKQKITLEKVNNIQCNFDQECIYIQFDGVNNASGYLVEVNVGTGLSRKLEKAETISFLSENMVEGKTYTISITSLGNGEYKNSDIAKKDFVYKKPEKLVSVNVSDFIGKSKEELEQYLIDLDVSFKAVLDEEQTCEDNKECVIEIEGLSDGNYSESDLSTKLVIYKYCMVVTSDD